MPGDDNTIGRLSVIGTGPQGAGGGQLTLRALHTLRAAGVVYVDPDAREVVDAALRDEARDASWVVLAEAGGHQQARLPDSVRQDAAAGQRVAWIVAGDPTEGPWDGAEHTGAFELEVLPAVRSTPVCSPRPLDGCRVLVTRPKHQAAETCRLLEDRGATVVCMPTIEIAPIPEGVEALRRALARDRAYDFLVLTSANAVAPLGEALAGAERDARVFAGAQVCAIGPGTARALARQLGIRPDRVPDDHRAEGLLEMLDESRVRGRRVLLPRAEVARELLPETLRARGATVDLIPVYRTGRPAAVRCRLGLEALAAGAMDVLTFTSASSAESFAALLGADLQRLSDGLLVVAIGPVTADACHRAGLEVGLMPKTYTLPAMVRALADHLAREQES